MGENHETNGDNNHRYGQSARKNKDNASNENKWQGVEYAPSGSVTPRGLSAGTQHPKILIGAGRHPTCTYPLGSTHVNRL